MVEKFIKDSEVVIYLPSSNSYRKRDYSGAFLPGALQFCKCYGLTYEAVSFEIDNTKSKRRMAECLLCDMERRYQKGHPQIYVFFCHGYTSGIQFGIKSPLKSARRRSKDKENWYDFVRLIARHKAPTVLLYACSTGNDPYGKKNTAPGTGNDSFGDLLRDGLCRLGAVDCRVVTHTTVGHSFYNPNIKIFDGNGSPLGGHGGSVLARPGTREYRKLQRLLRGEGDPSFVWSFPFMTIRDIHLALV